MILSQIMSKKVVTVGLDDDLATVKTVFDNVGFHHLLVEEHGILYGVISYSDLLNALSPFVGTDFATNRDAATLNKRVPQIMTRQPQTLGAGANVFDAVEVFAIHGVSCIPIVDNDKRIEGIVSWRDIMMLLHRNRHKLRKD